MNFSFIRTLFFQIKMNRNNAIKNKQKIDSKNLLCDFLIRLNPNKILNDVHLL
jgi:hypothetical protein